MAWWDDLFGNGDNQDGGDPAQTDDLAAALNDYADQGGTPTFLGYDENGNPNVDRGDYYTPGTTNVNPDYNGPTYMGGNADAQGNPLPGYGNAADWWHNMGTDEGGFLNEAGPYLMAAGTLTGVLSPGAGMIGNALMGTLPGQRAEPVHDTGNIVTAGGADNSMYQPGNIQVGQLGDHTQGEEDALAQAYDAQGAGGSQSAPEDPAFRGRLAQALMNIPDYTGGMGPVAHR